MSIEHARATLVNCVRLYAEAHARCRSVPVPGTPSETIIGWWAELKTRGDLLTDAVAALEKACLPETVYAVFCEGVYRHECIGVFFDEAAAKNAADAAARADNDSYHRYSVVPFTPNVGNLPAGKMHTMIFEPDAIYSVEKNTVDLVPKASTPCPVDFDALRAQADADPAAVPKTLPPEKREGVSELIEAARALRATPAPRPADWLRLYAALDKVTP